MFFPPASLTRSHGREKPDSKTTDTGASPRQHALSYVNDRIGYRARVHRAGLAIQHQLGEGLGFRVKVNTVYVL